MKKNSLLSILNVIFLIATLVVNYLANAIPINNLTTGEISDRFEIFFKPAGYAFSIWGVIYLGLLLFVFYQLWAKNRNPELIDKIGLFFILSCIANISWILDWHYELFTFTVIVMLVLLYSLIKIYLNLRIGIEKVSSKEKWLVHYPFSLYLGWIAVATLVNISVYIYWLRGNDFIVSQIVWFVLMSIIGLALSFYIALSRKDYIFNLVIIWGYTAIAVQNSGINTVDTISKIICGLALIPLIISIYRYTDTHQIGT